MGTVRRTRYSSLHQRAFYGRHGWSRQSRSWDRWAVVHPHHLKVTRKNLEGMRGKKMRLVPTGKQLQQMGAPTRGRRRVNGA